MSPLPLMRRDIERTTFGKVLDVSDKLEGAGCMQVKGCALKITSIYELSGACGFRAKVFLLRVESYGRANISYII